MIHIDFSHASNYDFYTCITKRNDHSFTGVDATLHDQGSHRYTPSQLESDHLDQIYKLANCLKNDYLSGDPMVKSRAQTNLLKRIMSLDNYQSTNSLNAPVGQDVCKS